VTMRLLPKLSRDKHRWHFWNKMHWSRH